MIEGIEGVGRAEETLDHLRLAVAERGFAEPEEGVLVLVATPEEPADDGTME